MDPENTIIINTERKKLPFPEAEKFRVAYVQNLSQFLGALEKVKGDCKEQVLVIDSMSSLLEMIDTHARERFGKSFDRWDEYASQAFKCIQMAKNSGKIVIFTCLEEIVEDAGSLIKRAKIEGKKLKGVEKEFLIVLWTVVRSEDEKMHYHFQTNTDGQNTAKSPIDMLDYMMDNDVNQVIERALAYYDEGKRPEKAD